MNTARGSDQAKGYYDKLIVPIPGTKSRLRLLPLEAGQTSRQFAAMDTYF